MSPPDTWGGWPPKVPGRHAQAWADVKAEFGERWDFRIDTGGTFVATIRNHGGHAPIPFCAASPEELAQQLRSVEALTALLTTA
ncbi:MAG TPA: hypothetical protein VN969_22810 [Streptosporangiaceae bacterium]|nr:hypothetical protein [Streptosporangiaceae bacterium]